MEENTLARRERRFLLAAAVGAAVCVLLAFWFAVPVSEQSSEAWSRSSAPLLESARVDLNTAGPEALTTLPGVGAKRAQAIVDYRLQKGAFQRVEDAAEIPGITPEIVALWQGLAYVS